MKTILVLLLIGSYAFAQTEDSLKAIIPTSSPKKSNLTWSGEFDNRYVKAYRFQDSGRLILTDHFRTQALIGMKVSPHEQVNVQGLLKMSRYWNPWLTQNQPSAGIYNLSTRQADVGDTVNIDRAYFDYSPVNWFTLYGGRLPTGDGMPAEYYGGEFKTGLFPKLALGSNVDGGLLGFHFDSWLPEKNHINFYLGYSPYLLQNYNFSLSTSRAKPTVDGGNTEAETLAPMAMTALEYIKEGENYKTFKILGFYRWLNYLRFPDATIDAASFDSSLSGSSVTRSTLAIFLKTYTLHTEMTDIANSGLDVSATWLMTQLTSQGRVVVNSGVGSGRVLGGFGTSRTDDTLNGNVLLLAAKYNKKIFRDEMSRIGVEYLDATKDSFFFDALSDDPSRFYETKGRGYHLYLAHTFVNSVDIRLGFKRQEYAWNATGLGDPTEDRSKVDSYYTDFRIIF